ncbi:MAG: Na(+)/H(+) antiporter subunit B [Planctomycetaceae bacterium]|nr:MAG: Na(+)/H(+) antiporter subunit B [Planctomycetaceae bacterium]
MVRQSDDIIIGTVARMLVPFIQLFALYVIMHGHYSPGGGFQGGVILGASLVLLLITHGLPETKKLISEKGVAILSSLGVLIYAGIGLLCLILLGNFLDYSQLSKILQVMPAEARSLGILGIETGVGLTVMAVMFSIFLDISTGGVLPEDEEE